MRKISFLRLMLPLSVFTIGLFCTVPANPQERDLGELARRVVTTSVSVKPGDVVVIVGGKHTIPLMEALAIEAQKAGGLVTMFLASDKVIRYRYMDAPENYLAQEPRYVAEWLKQVDVWINLPEASDIKALQAGVSAARLAKIDKANQFNLPLLDGMKYREADLILPTEERARSFRLDPATYINMVWGAIGADYQQISATGNALKKVLQGAKTVHITSPSGTNLTFAVGNRPIFIDDGIVSAEKAKSKRFLYLPERQNGEFQSWRGRAVLPGVDFFFCWTDERSCLFWPRAQSRIQGPRRKWRGLLSGLGWRPSLRGHWRQPSLRREQQDPGELRLCLSHREGDRRDRWSGCGQGRPARTLSSDSSAVIRPVKPLPSGLGGCEHHRVRPLRGSGFILLSSIPLANGLIARVELFRGLFAFALRLGHSTPD